MGGRALGSQEGPAQYQDQLSGGAHSTGISGQEEVVRMGHW